jgi:outer membrane protein assembly factor BamA
LTVSLAAVPLMASPVNGQAVAAGYGAGSQAQRHTALDFGSDSDSGSAPAKPGRHSTLPAHSTIWATRSSGPSVTFEEYEGRPVVAVEISFEGSAADPAAEAEFLSIIRVVPNTEFSAVVVRDSLQALFDSERVANARVEVFETGARGGPIRLRFVIKRQVQIGDIKFDLTPPAGTPITVDELRAQVTLSQPGARLSRQIVTRNAEALQVFLRDRGYYHGTVESAEQLDASGTRATVTYRIVPGPQSHVEAFNIRVTGFDPSAVKLVLQLQPGAPFTHEALGADIKRLQQAIIDQGYLAPVLGDPRLQWDAEHDLMTIDLTGVVGPKVNVVVPNFPMSEKTARELLPVKREGNVDQSAIIEGARRLRNKLQEQGYFFAEVTPVCTVTPAIPDLGPNGEASTCETLNPENLSGHTVEIRYDLERGRRFKLTDIRITGTNKLTYDDVAADLRSQKASPLGLIPFLAYGRGYTSLTLLEQDRRTVEAFMRDLGYRRVKVDVLQGVSINGESLIITFNVNEGPLTRIAGVELRGNKIYTDERLRDELKTVIGGPYSRSQARADGERMIALYAREGYVNAQMSYSTVDLPRKGDEEQVRLIYSISNEGDKVFINHIVVNGVTGTAKVQATKRQAILRAIPIAEGDVLRSDRIADSERDLYLTDAFRQVIIRSEPAGETAAGFKRRDVIIDVEEKKPRVMDYGGGASTDAGPFGLFEVSNVNLMNKLRQGTMRLRASRQQQLVRFEYLDPRFKRYGDRNFAPLSLSVEYKRDSTVTRFFRSAIDQGTMGIVQRVDVDGNPLDDFGRIVSEPTINRFSAAIETQRVLNPKIHSAVFLRYSYDDVRLYNLESLLVKPVLLPDRKVRLSRFGVSYVRDTREKCERGLLGTVHNPDEETGAPGEICRYNQFDATRGYFFNIDYGLALRQLGGNISFNRMQASYRTYYKVNALRGTVFAANATLGLANVFNARDRNDNGVIDEVDLTMPISERFFAGGSTSLRGFNFEEAGPRVAIIPFGTFIDQNKEPVTLNPFTVPIGGNALAILNLEARIPFTRTVQVVPFYDGGNVFRRVSDLFGKHKDPVIPPGDILAAIQAANLRSHWSNTVGLGIRIQTPLGGALAIDYGFLLNPPSFLIPQRGPSGGPFDFTGTPAIYVLRRQQIHFRFTQTF